LTGDPTILLAIAAGLLSFLSPCVLPLVPAYLGQLTAVAVAGSAAGSRPSRWTAFRHAVAYVAGFGIVFTLLGVTATFASAGLAPFMPVLRQIGGAILIVLGLNLAGVLRIPGLERTWRPLDAGASASIADAAGTR
jgi:cytochrome c-type biogenesis protein